MTKRTQKADVNWKSFADVKNIKLEKETVSPPNPENYDDILKFSNVQNANVYDCDINPKGGNKEDGVDINRFCKNIRMVKTSIRSGEKYAVTIKGGSEDILLQNVIILGRGKEGVDIDIGNYSDSTMKKSQNIMLANVNRADGKPVTLRVGHAKNIFITDSNIKKLRFQSIGLKLYVYFKYLLVKLKLIGWEDK